MQSPPSYKNRLAATLYGKFFTFVDHLAPLSALLQIPLIVTDEEIARVVTSFYPTVNVEIWNGLQICSLLPDLYDATFSCLLKPTTLLTTIGKDLGNIWLPHGNSDKGRKSLQGLSMLKSENALCIYGEQMLDYLKESGVLNQEKALFKLGNFRYHYYLRHKTFYDKVTEKLLQSLNPQNKTILYAPSRSDKEATSSYTATFRHLIEHLPKGFNLIIKPHPLLILQEPAALEETKTLCQNRTGLLFLENFTPVYPLLSKVDLYLGDTSSIGYDFLTFQKPLFFFTTEKDEEDLFLHRCGTKLSLVKEKSTYEVIEKILSQPQDFRKEVQRSVYEYVFGKQETEEEFLKRFLEVQNDLTSYCVFREQFYQ